MLESTFIHCPGIGPGTERRIWRAGARTWRDFLALRREIPLPPRQSATLPALVEESQKRLEARDFAWFAERIPVKEHWRAWTAFRTRAAFLDIETTGGNDPRALTVIGAYDGLRLVQFVRGENLDEFPEWMADRALIVTFFGTGFDVPFLRRAFRMELPQLHIDLCHALRRLGHRGGLKRVEQAFGIRRSNETAGLDGWDAVRLWWAWQAGDERAGRKLLAYNAEDVLNLEILLNAAYPMLEARAAGGSERASGVVGHEQGRRGDGEAA